MMQNFEKRLDALKYARDEQWKMFYSQSHIDNLDEYIAEANAAVSSGEASIEDKLAAIKKLNDEFNTIEESYDAYQALVDLSEYCYNKVTELQKQIQLSAMHTSL